MEATESMSVLARAGRSEEALDVVRRAADRAARSYDEIMADETRTEDFKRGELEAVANLAAIEEAWDRITAPPPWRACFAPSHPRLEGEAE